MMRYSLYLPGIILLLLPFMVGGMRKRAAIEAERQKAAQKAAEAERKKEIAAAKQAERDAKAAEREQARAIREAERQRKQAERLEMARQRAEYAERELAAKRAMKELERSKAIPEPAPKPETITQETPATEADNTDPVPEPSAAQEPAPKAEPIRPHGNNAFAGHVVAFTGKLPGMTRREAIAAVQANGGRAYTTMPAGTTLLVVGDKPGMCKMDKADEWIGQVRKITAKQFDEMLNQPITMELEEFAALYAA